jgi:hypothetical protein
LHSVGQTDFSAGDGRSAGRAGVCVCGNLRRAGLTGTSAPALGVSCGVTGRPSAHGPAVPTLASKFGTGALLLVLGVSSRRCCYCLDAAGHPLVSARTGEALGTVGSASREDRHGEEGPGVVGSQVAVGSAQKTPLICQQAFCPWAGLDGGRSGSLYIQRRIGLVRAGRRPGLPLLGCGAAGRRGGDQGRSQVQRRCSYSVRTSLLRHRGVSLWRFPADCCPGRLS